jgi:predicted MFS family arabinose efflux permease
MAYFVAFVAGVPSGAFAASRFGWQTVFAGLSAIAIGMIAAVARLPADSATRRPREFSLVRIGDHFHKSDRLAGIAAAFLTSGGIAGFLTYVGAWLATNHGIGVDRIGLVFMVCGFAAIAAAPISGWLADHASKQIIIICSNLALAGLFVAVARADWGWWLIFGVALLSVAAAARQAPLHALTSEIVEPELRGEYMALRNAASQAGIGAVATISAYAFDAGGFTSVAAVAASVTLLIPVSCIWLKEPTREM